MNDVQYAIEHGIIDTACVQEIENMKREEYLKMHPYSITFGSDGYWHTYLPLANKKRKPVKKKHEADIQNAVIDFWKNNTTSTFKTRYQLWMKRQKDCGRSDNTICKYESDYIRFFEGDEIENKDIRNIDTVYLCKFIEKLLKRKEIPYRALQSMIGYINGVFEVAIIDELISKNPAKLVDVPIYKQYCKQPRIKSVEERTMSQSEKSSLLKILDDKYREKPDYIVQYAVELSLYTGMRSSELSGLMWTDIDYLHNTIMIQHAERHNRKTDEYYVTIPKNGKIRSFPLTTEIADVLARVKKAEMKYGYLSEYVFSNENGRIHARTISECMRARTSSEEFYNTKCIHSARRTLNSELSVLDVPRTVRSALIGNTERVNEQYYTYDISDAGYKMAMVSQANKNTALTV